VWVAGRKRVFVGLVVVDHPNTVVVVVAVVTAASLVAIIFKVSNVFACTLLSLSEHFSLSTC